MAAPRGTQGKQCRAAIRRTKGNELGPRVRVGIGAHHRSVGRRVDSLKVKGFFVKICSDICWHAEVPHQCSEFSGARRE